VARSAFQHRSGTERCAEPDPVRAAPPAIVEIAVADMQHASFEVEVGLGKSQQFSSSQPGQVKKMQCGAEDRGTYGTPPARRQLDTGLQKPPALISAEHARHKLP